MITAEEARILAGSDIIRTIDIAIKELSAFGTREFSIHVETKFAQNIIDILRNNGHRVDIEPSNTDDDFAGKFLIIKW